MYPNNLLAFLALQLPQSYSPLDDEVPLGEGLASPISPSFDDFVLDNLDYWHVPGLSIAVVDGDEIFSKVCYALYFCQSD